MHWVYILRCKDDYYYVGETTRLYRRFWEHQGGRGGLNTSTYSPEEIVAIYKVSTICKFMNYNEYVSKIIDSHEMYNSFELINFNNENNDDNYDHLCAENNIAECLMMHKKEEWNKIRGGKYTRLDIEYNCPNNDYIKDLLPLCKCGFPCDIRKNEDNNLYFRCAKKNMWEGLREKYDNYTEPCNFYMEYTKDKQLKQERSEIIKELVKKSRWLKNVELNDDTHPTQCIGGCNRTNTSIKLSYSYVKRNLCFDCFIEKNEELSDKYNDVHVGWTGKYQPAK